MHVGTLHLEGSFYTVHLDDGRVLAPVYVQPHCCEVASRVLVRSVDDKWRAVAVANEVPPVKEALAMLECVGGWPTESAEACGQCVPCTVRTAIERDLGV